MARCAAAISSDVSGCLTKWTAVSSWLYVKRFGASSRQRRHNAQLISTYHCPGAFSDCLPSLSATIQVNSGIASKKISSGLTSAKFLSVTGIRNPSSGYRRYGRGRGVGLGRGVGVGWGMANKARRSPIAGLLIGKYGLGAETGFGKLSRLRDDNGGRFQFHSMNFRIDA